MANYTYNANNGKINQIEYGNGFTVRYVYDKLDNLSEVWYNDGVNDYKAYVYTYTDNGQIAQLDNLLTERSTVYSYDSTGKLIGYAECDTGSKIISHGVQLSYDDYSQLSHQTRTIDYLYGTAVGNHYYYYHYAYNDDGTISETSIDIDDGTVGERYQGTISYTYDAYNRLTGAVTNISLYNNSGVRFNNTVGYEYTTINNRTSTQIEKYTSQVNSNAQKVYTYTYDDNGNITSISLGGVEQYRYEYDDIGQLIREDNVVSNKTYTYTYDNAGNILTKKTYALTAAGTEPTSPTSTNTYTYGNANWGDQLTAFNGVSLTYDAIGNPLTYYNGSTRTLTWKNGRQLATYTYGSTSISFDYNDEGIRTTKTVGGTVYTYHLNGTQIVAEEWENKLLIYLYDASGSPIGMQYRTTSYAEGVFDTYWFEKNLQGDIVAVYNDAGTLLVKYVYDAWGNTVSTTYSNGGASTIVRYNRFRYRGYYYDTETGFYYLNSRYYDPSTGRFINADGLLFGSLLGSNLYAYCENSPTIWQDPSGNAKEKVVDFDAECPLKLWPNGLDGGMSSSQCWMTGQDRYYSYGVDLSFAARSSLFHGGIYNCGYTFYTYYNTTGLYDSSSYSGTTYVTNGSSSYGNITSESPVGRIPYDRQTLNHIFSNRPGHICDSHSNRTLLESTTIKSNYLTTDIYGNDWYAQTLSDGRQVWVEVQGTRIWDGGINIVPRPWNSETGLKKKNK